MKKSILLFSLLFLSKLSLAQFQLSGILITQNQVPIEYASVSIFPLSDSTQLKGVISNQKGQFLLTNLNQTTYQLTVQMIGYEDWQQQIDLTKSIQLQPILLKETTTLLKEVEVVARQSTVESHLGKKVLRIGQDISSSGSTAIEALENIPSIATTPKGQIQIRGNSNVIIYINGKETKRSPTTLKFIAAESLEKIEVITNPSAKYDAEGVGGIINLVYKKNKIQSFKLEGLSNLSLASNPLTSRSDIGLNASISQERFSFFTNLTYDYSRYQDLAHTSRQNLGSPDSILLFENATVHHGIGKVANASLGFTLEPDTSFSLGLEMNFDQWDLANEIEQTSSFEYRSSPEETLDFNTNREELENELWINFSLKKEMKKHQLNASFTVGGENESNFSQLDEMDGLSGSSTSLNYFLASSQEKEQQRYYLGKIDYEIPFNRFGTIETGIKTDFIQYNILQKIELLDNANSLADNDFQINLQKIGAYLIHKHQIKKLEYALGLRVEHFASQAIQQANQTRFTQDFTGLFPSVQLNYLIAKHEQTLGFNYTRRMNRPRFFHLNPYISYEDPLNLETGNPSLEPEIGDLFELNYHLEKDQLVLDITAYYNEVKHAIQSILQVLATNQTLTIPMNIGQERQKGLGTQLEYRFPKGFKTSGTLVVNQATFNDAENEISYNRQFNWGLRLQQQWRLAKDWKIELSEIYNGPSFEAQQKTHAVYYMNLGIRKRFKNKRGSISLVVRDLFNTRQYVYSIQTTAVAITKTYKWQTRQINLGLKYVLFETK